MRPIDIGDEHRVSKETPAPLSGRFAAGLIDFVALFLLTALLAAAPFLFTGVLIPALAVLSSALVLAIAPLWLFKRTLGMRLCGLMMVGRGGHPAELGDLLFRELMLRGVLPFTYVFTLVGGVIASYLGVARVAGNAPLATAGFGMALMFGGAATAGNLVALSRADHRTLADLLSKTLVIPYRAPAAPADAEELAEQRAAGRRRLRNFVVFTGIALAVPLGAPFLATARRPAKDLSHLEAKLARERLEQRVRENASDGSAAARLAEAYRAEGRAADAERVEQGWRDAEAKAAAAHEAAYQARLAANPADAHALEGLIALYREHDRLQDAKAAYRTFVDKNPGAEERAGFGVWLYRYDLNEDAVEQLRQAISEGANDAETQAYLGFALKQLGRKDEARKAFKAALKAAPSLEEVRAALAELDAP